MSSLINVLPQTPDRELFGEFTGPGDVDGVLGLIRHPTFVCTRGVRTSTPEIHPASAFVPAGKRRQLRKLMSRDGIRAALIIIASWLAWLLILNPAVVPSDHLGRTCHLPLESGHTRNARNAHERRKRRHA